MSTQLDVYRDWLGIKDTNRPLNFYQLLKLEKFEDNTMLIRKRYRDLNAHVRKFASGYIDESQALLNELAKAMLCLTDAERKIEYDASLGRSESTAEEPQSERTTFEDILIRNKIITADQLKKAQNYADAVGLDLQMAVLQQKLAAPEVVMLAFAESIGLPFINLDDIPVDEYYAPMINPVTARQHSFVPVMADMGKLILASPAPLSLDVEEELRILFDMPVRAAICIPTQVNAAIAKYYPRDAVQLVRAPEGSGKGAKAAKKEKKSKQNSNDGEKNGESEEKTPSLQKKKNANAVFELSKEAKKNRLLATIVAFNFTLGMTIGFMNILPLLDLVRKAPSSISQFAVGIVLGAVVAGLTWFLMTKKALTENDV